MGKSPGQAALHADIEAEVDPEGNGEEEEKIATKVVVIDPSKGKWLRTLSSKKGKKSPPLHKKKITFVQGVENDSLLVIGSKDGTAKIYSAADFQQKKILPSKEAGVRCGTAFRSEKIIAVQGSIERVVWNLRQRNPTLQSTECHISPRNTHGPR
jgi:hypothetical protein